MICTVRELVTSDPSARASYPPPFYPPQNPSDRPRRFTDTHTRTHTQPGVATESEPPRFPRDPNHLSLHGTQIIVATCPSIIRGLNHSSASETLSRARVLSCACRRSERVDFGKGAFAHRRHHRHHYRRHPLRRARGAHAASLSLSFASCVPRRTHLTEVRGFRRDVKTNARSRGCPDEGRVVC